MTRTTEADCLEALWEAADRLGESPTKTQYEKLDITPSSTTILRIMGGWNEAKVQAGLETYSKTEGGGTEIRPKPEGVELPDGYVWEELTAQQRWYYENREHRIEVKERRRKRLQRWLYEFKRERVSCDRCGEPRPRTLDFHHTGEKRHAVSKMITDGYSKQRILDEIERCTPLCVNCHRRDHYEGPDLESVPKWSKRPHKVEANSKRGRRIKRRRWVIAYKRDTGGCERCDATHPACLDFHHEADKEMSISKMVSFGRSLEEIYNEMQKCIVLCANCHRVEHRTTPPEIQETDSV